MAQGYLGEEVESVEDALSGARDIIAETVSENATLRQKVRYIYQRSGVLASMVQKGKEEEGIKYRNYFDYSENISSMAPHRLLAPVSYTHLRAHETVLDLVCRLLLEKKKQQRKTGKNS